MRSTSASLLACALGFAAVIVTPSYAQDGTSYVVSYVEATATSRKAAATLLREFAAASRKEDGSVRFEVVQNIHRPQHFAVLEVWKDNKARETHAAAAGTKAFRDKLATPEEARRRRRRRSHKV